MKSASRSRQINTLKAVSWVRAAQFFRLLREHYPGTGLALAACLSLARWRNREDPCPTYDQPKKILVIRLDAMGDLVMATPIFRELKQAYPTASITALVQKANLEILETNPFVDRILTLLPTKGAVPSRRLRRNVAIARLYWQSLRGEHFDLAVQPRLGPDYFGANLLLALVNASSRTKYEDDLKSGLSQSLARIAFRSITELPKPALQHEVLSNRAFVRQLTGRAFDCSPEVFLNSGDRSYSRIFDDGFRSESTVLCVAFGAQAKRRQWPLERWADTIRLLSRNRKLNIAIICSLAERYEGERLGLMLQSVSGAKSRIISGARLREVAACVKKCDLLLAVDSGVAHLAAAAGCAVLVVSPHPVNGDLYHENSPLRFRPYSDRARVVQSKISRYPCKGGCDAVEPHCILDITPTQVIEVVEEMLLADQSAFRSAVQGKDSIERKRLSSARVLDTPFPHTLVENDVAVTFPAALHQKEASK